jgi:hypothetical protein
MGLRRLGRRLRDVVRNLPGGGGSPVPIPIPIPVPPILSSPIPGTVPLPGGPTLSSNLSIREQFDQAIASVRQGLQLPEVPQEVIDILELRSKLVRKLGQALGGDAEKILADAESITHPISDEAKTAALLGLLKFLETGDANYLQPIVIITIGLLRKARDDLWDKAYPIHDTIIQAMPPELHSVLRKCRMMKLSDVPGTINYPSYAIRQLKQASACALIDLIVFETIPPVDGNHDYAHEFWHLKQFDELGVDEFVKRYLTSDFKPATPGPDGDVNEMEREADYFACKHFFIEKPAYVDHCPV